MVQQDERTQQALAYIRHQASKRLASLRLLAERTAADCNRCLEGFSEGQARFKPGNEWSVKEVLGHLIEATALQATQGIRDLAAGMAPRLLPADDSRGRATRSIDELRKEMARLLDEAVLLVSALPQGELPAGTYHVMDHVQQIATIKADPGYPAD